MSKKKKISLSFPNALFSAFNQDLKVPLHPTTRTTARAYTSFCHSASIPLLLCVLHSCPFYQPALDLIVPNKSFFIDITSPSLLYFPSSSSPSSLYNFCFIVHCLRICFDLVLNCVSIGQNWFFVFIHRSQNANLLAHRQKNTELASEHLGLTLNSATC